MILTSDSRSATTAIQSEQRQRPRERPALNRLAVVLLILVLLTGPCGCLNAPGPTANRPTTPSQPTTPTTPTTPVTPAQPASIWTDIPTWFRGTQVDSAGGRRLPAPAGTWTTTEWRYYEIPDAIPSLRNFFLGNKATVAGLVIDEKSQMEEKGWTKVAAPAKQENPDVNTHTSNWTKNDGRDGAMIYLATWGVGVFLAVARSTK